MPSSHIGVAVLLFCPPEVKPNPGGTYKANEKFNFNPSGREEQYQTGGKRRRSDGVFQRPYQSRKERTGDRNRRGQQRAIPHERGGA